MRQVLALVVAALVLTGCGTDPDQPRAASDRLPDVTLPSLTGGTGIDLGDLRGPVVVNLWAQWCEPCKRELPIYQAFFARHGARVPVVGIDWQDTQADLARGLARDSGLTYPLVVDDEPEIRAVGLPKVLLIDAEGKIVHEEYVEIKTVVELEQLVEKHLGVRL